MTLKDQHLRLLEQLQNDGNWLSARRLSSILNVSTRTIRTYINQINESKAYQIESSKEGYRLASTNPSYTTTSFSTPKQRINYITHQLLYELSFDYYDLADSLYISIPTIEKDLLVVKENLRLYDLTYHKHGSMIYIKGDETKIRQMTSNLLKEEITTKFMGIEYIQSIFIDIDAKVIKECIQSVCKRHCLYINGYIIDNVVLHIMIAIDRVLHGKISETTIDVNPSHFNPRTYQTAQEIGSSINTLFNITLSNNEISYIALLLTTKSTLITDNEESIRYIEQYLKPEYITIVRDVMNDVKKYYNIDILEPEFYMNFALHIQNLVVRSTYKSKINNPLIHDLKKSHPFVYNLSVYVSGKLQKKLNIEISEDEIAFISLHLGSFIERMNEIETKATCLIISPGYYSIKGQLLDNIEQHFKERLEVRGIYNHWEDISNLEIHNVDLLICTFTTSMTKEIPMVSISPFLSKKDQKEIHTILQSIEKQKLQRRMHTILDTYFHPSLFEKNIYLKDEYAYIDYMGQKLVKQNRINHDFISLIKKREKMSSTAFNNFVAMPHALEMKAKKTTISIIINEKPICWGDTTIKIIAMVVMNEKERKEFRIVFDYLIDLLSEKEVVNSLIKCNSYQEFVDTLSSKVNIRT